ncbi:uncharacterized protein BX664DRAFT_358155 [Halteromyces radiatus]|uniref:uncharacterized protein n=1 Tax=Halteromyces radiatus TaxID=101107 RepID=UPI00221F26F4|nr:uncharacterized protein BX664DRAFT_358155 [Halteromyces radiatus]KAI8093756.1 hypothetical protein BX664DRAFT_358155 [Halteromyces radiatus]
MNMPFLYEDGQGHVVDENGVEPMGLVVDEELFVIETVNCQSCNKRRYTLYSDENKTRVFHLFFGKCLNASTAARQLRIHIRPAQRWAKRCYEDPESIFEKKKKPGRRRILWEEHKQFLLNYIVENPPVVVAEMAEILTQNFVWILNVSCSTIYNFMTTECDLSIKQAQFQPIERNSEEKIQQRYDWVPKWQQTDMDFTTNYVFLDESAFHVNLKQGMAWSKKGTPAIVTVPTTKANATSVLVKEKWVGLYAGHVAHLGNRTTNRVEGAHAKLKQLVTYTNASMETVFESIDRWYSGMWEKIEQRTEIESFRYDHSFMLDKDVHRMECLRLKTSKFAFNRLKNGVVPASYRVDRKDDCECEIKIQYKLPCAHMISGDSSPIPLSMNNDGKNDCDNDQVEMNKVIYGSDDYSRYDILKNIKVIKKFSCRSPCIKRSK